MRVRFSDSHELLEICKKSIELLRSNENQYSPIPVILSTALALETILNDAIISGAGDLFPYEAQNRMASSLLTMSLRGKLDIAPTLVSNNEYYLLAESNLYQNLVKLISIRNSLAHNKGFSHEIDPAELTQDPVVKLDKFQEKATQDYNSRLIRTLTLKDAEKYLKSVTQLHELLHKKNNDFIDYPDIFKNVLF